MNIRWPLILVLLASCKSDPNTQTNTDSQASAAAADARRGPLGDTSATVKVSKPKQAGLSFEIRTPEQGGDGISVKDKNPTTAVKTPAAKPVPLDAKSQAKLLARMEDITKKGSDTKSFALRKGSRPAPRPGTTVKGSFPPPPRPLPPPSKPEPLTVLRVSPEGDVRQVPKVSLTFSQPMVPISSVSTVEALEVPVTLTPQPPGKWNWLGTRTLQFEPEGRMPMATRYTVRPKANTKSEVGGVLKAPESVVFVTPPPSLTSQYPTGNQARLHPELGLYFDQDVDPNAVLQRLQVKVNGKRWKATLLTGDALKKSTVPAQYRGSRAVALKLPAELPKDATVRIEIAKGLPSAEGPLTTKNAIVAGFKTYPPLVFKKLQCGWRNNCPPMQPWSLQFNHQLDIAAFDKDWVKVTPELPKMEVDLSYSSITIKGRSKGRTTYTVELSPDIVDIYGQKLGEKVTARAKVGPAQPLARIEGDFYAVMDPHGPRTLSMFSINVPSVDVRLRRVAPEEWPEYIRSAHSQRWQENLPALTVGEEVFRKVVQIERSDDELVETAIDLSPALTKGKGHVVMELRPARDAQKRIPLRFIQWVESTQLSPTVFTDHKRMLVWVTDLKDGKPVAGAEVQLSPKGLSAKTGADGIAEFTLPPSSTWNGPDAGIIVRKGNDATFFPERQWHTGGTSWTQRHLPDSTRWFTFDDRGLYKPKETVRIKGWIRSFTRGPKGDLLAKNKVDKISWAARGPRGNELGKGVLRPNAQGGFDLEIKLPDDVNLGTAYVSFSPETPDVSASSHNHSFSIQEFRRPEFEVKAKADPAPWVVGQQKEISVEAKYFTGGALPEAEVNWTVYSSPGSYTPPGWSSYTFGQWTPWWRHNHFDGPYGRGGRRGGDVRQNAHSLSGKTDASGLHELVIDLNGVNPARTMTLTAEASVVDVNRQRWSSSVSRVVHPADRLVGLNTNRYFLARNEELELQHVVVDIDGRAQAGVPVKIEAKLQKWKTVGGRNQQVEGPVAAECAATSSDKPQTCTLELEDSGTYKISATVVDASGREHITERSIWVAGAEAPPSRRLAQEELQLIPSTKEFEPGSTAEILVVAPFSKGQGLLTLRRDGLVNHQTFEFEEGSHVLKIPIEDAHIPTLHVEVDLVGSASRGDDGAPRRPAFASGSMVLKIPARSRTLKVTATPDATEVDPGAKVGLSVIVHDANGKAVAAADVAVAVVDEAVLALAGPRVLDPVAAFYPGLAAGMTEWHARQFVVLGDPEALAQAAAEEPEADKAMAESLDGASMGAANMASGKMAPQRTMAKSKRARAPAPAERREQAAAPNAPIAVRKDFSALAHFSPSVMTDAQGRVNLQVDLPDNLTRYRIYVFAAAGKNFGHAESNVTARQRLMVRPSAPRFLNFGDSFELPIVLENQTSGPLDVQVAVRATNMSIGEVGGYTVSVPAKDRVEVRFPAAAQLPGTARFQVAAAAGSAADAAEVELPVWTPATTEAFATYGSITKGTVAHTVQAPKDARSEFGGLKISTSSTQLQALTDAFIYLYSYPYGCAEQVSSRVLSVAALRDVMVAFEVEGMPRKKELDAAMAADLNKLARLQNDDGGWGFWRRYQRSYPFVSVHVMHALTRAKIKGFEVNEQALTRGQAYLKAIRTRMPSWYSPRTKNVIEAYALYVRAITGDYDTAAAKRIVKAEGGMKKADLELLGWIYPVLIDGKDSQSELQRLRKRLRNSVTETAGTAHFVTGYSEGAHLLLHSSRRVDGILLEGMLRDQPKNDIIEKLVRGLLAHKKKGRWSNTQENVWVLIGLDRYFRVYEGITPSFVARAWLGEGYAGEHAFRGRTTETHEITVPMEEVLKQEKSTLLLQKDGKGRMYYRLGMSYAPKSLDLDALDRGFDVSRSYEAIDDASDVRQEKDGSWVVKAGARVRVNLQMVATGRRYHVALVDKLPAGFEPVNPTLAAQERPAPSSSGKGMSRGWWWGPWYEHQNLRDERAEAFASLLYAGSYSYSYTARATTPGNFVAPPAKAEEMYMPETFGRSATTRVRVVE